MSGFLGGIDLGTPGRRNEPIIRRELELRRTRKPRSGWGKVYLNGADLLLKHGRFYPGRPLPEQYEHLRGEFGRCYWNAAEAAEADPSLRYCEGVTTSGAGRFLSHAWCLDPDDGVLDFTWLYAPHAISAQTNLAIPPPQHWGYFGVVLQPDLVLSGDYDMPLLGRDVLNEMTRGSQELPDGRLMTPTGIDVTPPDRLPLLDVTYNPSRTTLS